MKTTTCGVGFLLAVATVACSQQSPGTPATPSATVAPSSDATRSAQGGAKLPATISVTTIVGDLDSFGAPADIASDGGGPYVDNVAGVSSVLVANGYNGIAYGDWQFLKSATGREIAFSLDQNDAVLPGDPHFTTAAKPPFWGSQKLVGHMEVKCTLLSKSMLTMTAGSVITCPLLPKFTAASGTVYSLSLGPSFTGFTETTDVQIRCNSVETTLAPSGCNDWYIDPIAPAQSGVARLAGTTKGGFTIDDKVNLGDFYIRFHFHITRP